MHGYMAKGAGPRGPLSMHARTSGHAGRYVAAVGQDGLPIGRQQVLHEHQRTQATPLVEGGVAGHGGVGGLHGVRVVLQLGVSEQGQWPVLVRDDRLQVGGGGGDVWGFRVLILVHDRLHRSGWAGLGELGLAGDAD